MLKQRLVQNKEMHPKGQTEDALSDELRTQIAREPERRAGVLPKEVVLVLLHHQ